MDIKTGKTAIRRNGPSAPLTFLLSSIEDIERLTGRNLTERVTEEVRVFDHGCGLGEDVEHLKKLGYLAKGYDPNHKPKPAPWGLNSGSFDLVLCTYVLNVLPFQEERIDALKMARRLVHEHGALAVTVRSRHAISKAKNDSWKPYSDGFVTSANTFQRGFSAAEMAATFTDLGFDIVYNLHTTGDFITTVGVEMYPSYD